jgi:hypothetical protein
MENQVRCVIGHRDRRSLAPSTGRGNAGDRQRESGLLSRQDQPSVGRHRERMGARVDCQLVEDGGEVVPHCALGDDQILGDPLVRKPVRHQVQDFVLSWTENAGRFRLRSSLRGSTEVECSIQCLSNQRRHLLEGQGAPRHQRRFECLRSEPGLERLIGDPHVRPKQQTPDKPRCLTHRLGRSQETGEPLRNISSTWGRRALAQDGSRSFSINLLTRLQHHLQDVCVGTAPANLVVEVWDEEVALGG